MSELQSNDPNSGASRRSDATERVVCVIAKDVLELERRETGFGESIAGAVWRRRWLLIAFVVCFGVLSTAYALLATQWFLAEAVLTPATPMNQQGLGSQLGGLSVAADLVGLNLDGRRDTEEPIAVLKSRDFARQFIEERGLLHVLLWNAWDAQVGRWKESNARRQPDIRDAIQYFDKSVLQVQEDRRTGLVTVGIRWLSPTVAADWANAIVARLNQQMRARALSEGEANISYLQKELATATQVPVQQAIGRLLETEMQKVMLARGSTEYSFRVVDPAAVPKLRDWPKRTVVVAIGVLFGTFAGLFAVFVRELIGGVRERDHG